jgi:hypothetical protein
MKPGPLKPELPEIADEPGWAERFQRGLRRALNTPPKHRTARKERIAKAKPKPAVKPNG